MRWGRLSSLPVRRTFQSGLGATRKSPQLADKNVCPTQAALRHRLANFGIQVSDRRVAAWLSSFKHREGDTPIYEAAGKTFSVTARGNVGEADLVGKGSDKLVAADREFGCDALFCGLETG